MAFCKIGTPGRKEYKVDVYALNSIGARVHTTYSIYTTSKTLAEKEAKERANNNKAFKTVIFVKAQ